MSFQTVEQLQAQIVTLTAENKRLTNENWRFQMGEAVMLKPHLNLIGRLKAEIERLRALVKEAYEGGWDSARYGSRTDDDDWLTSNARATLQPKEGGDD